MSSALQEFKYEYPLAPLSSSNFMNLLENLLSITGNDLFFIKTSCCYSSRCCYSPDIYFVLSLKMKERKNNKSLADASWYLE